jgi:hypothetical protein
VEAASIEELKLNLEKTREDLKQAREDLKAAAEGEQEQLQHAVAALEQREQWFTRLVKENERGA